MKIASWWYRLPRIEQGIWLCGLLFHVVAFFYSTGSHHADEHFQILEFAAYKLGWNTHSSLAWEYDAAIRPGLQPFIAFLWAKTLALGSDRANPFAVYDGLRALSVGLGFFSLLLLRKSLQVFWNDAPRGIWVSAALCFMPWMPYIHARFSSENFSGICILFALSALFRQGIPGTQTSLKTLLLTGILAGLAFEFRFQVAILSVVAVIWLWVYSGLQWKQYVQLAAGLVLVLALSACIDFWLYERWVFPPALYFYETLLNPKDKFGVSPWTEYIALMERALRFPWGWLLILAFIRFIRKPSSIFAWMAFGFILAHSAIGHKELRFLFPAFPLLALMVAEMMPVSLLRQREQYRNEVLRKCAAILMFAFFFLQNLAYSSMQASPDVKVFRYLSAEAQKGDITLFCPYDIGYVMAHAYEFRFYRDKRVHLRFYRSDVDLDKQWHSSQNAWILIWNSYGLFPRQIGMETGYVSQQPWPWLQSLRPECANPDIYRVYRPNN